MIHYNIYNIYCMATFIIVVNYSESFNSFLSASSKQDFFVIVFNCLYVFLNVSGSIRNRCQRIAFSRSKFVSAFYNERFQILYK